MEVFSDAFSSGDLPRGGVGTIGNFDGVHKGQREVIGAVLERAEALSTPSVVVTFEPHPLEILRPSEAPLRITSLERKKELMEELGVDVLAVVQFNAEVARTSAEDFVDGFLHKRLELQEIYVGAGFVFGQGREGDVPLLQKMGESRGFTAVGLPEVVRTGARVSSTRIRQAILEGRVEDAQEMLCRPFDVRGEVTRGDRMGKRLGWPTINLDLEGELLPADGVYACRVRIPAFPATFDCATNVGTRPTVYENYQRVVESHILDFNTDIYGETVELSFYKRLREERIFPTVMDLSSQIRDDVEETREFFAAHSGFHSTLEG